MSRLQSYHHIRLKLGLRIRRLIRRHKTSRRNLSLRTRPMNLLSYRRILSFVLHHRMMNHLSLSYRPNLNHLSLILHIRQR